MTLTPKPRHLVRTWTAATVQTWVMCTDWPALGVILPNVSSDAAPKMEVYSATLRAMSSDIRHCVISCSASVACDEGPGRIKSLHGPLIVERMYRAKRCGR